MDENKQMVLQFGIKHAMQQLQKNNMDAYYAVTKEEAVRKVEGMLHPGDVVATGGSVTLKESGVMDLLRSGAYRYLDQEESGLSAEEKQEIYHKAICADVYLCSANAVTMDGELYNVDGNSNRVAALLYGPKSVIVVAGYNKLVENVEEAVARVKRLSAPANCLRLHCDTPCSKTGRCVSERMGGGCGSQGRVCANYVVSARQRVPGRIKVILVGESLGY